jgi:hypothetical protein
LKQALVLSAPQPGNIHRHEDVGGAVGSLAADALDDLIGVALHPIHGNARFLLEKFVQFLVCAVVPRGVEVHFPIGAMGRTQKRPCCQSRRT